MPPPQDISSYVLPPSTSHEIFTTTILPAEFSTHPAKRTQTSSSRPLALLVVGQTGAGKTRTAPPILTHLTTQRTPPPLHLIADIYKAFHPSYASLSATSSALAARATGPDARRWLAMAVDEAIARGLDVLLESACRHPQDFNNLAGAFSSAGYRLEVVVMAVPEGLSRLGILARFYGGCLEGTGGLGVRLTPRGVHDESFGGLVDAAEWVDGSGEVDQVVVVRRGNLVAFGAEKEGKEGFGGRVVEAIRRERRRKLTDEERRFALADMERLEGVERAADELNEVKALLEPLMSDGVEDDEFPELKPLLFPGEGGGTGSNVLKLGTT